jgi:lysophospholipase L1-like esterase
MIFDKGDKVLFIGDSVSDYERQRPVGEGLFNAWGRSYVAEAASLLYCTYPQKHLRFVNMGVAGHTVRDLMNRWQTDVMDLKPDWVSILIGINDVWCQFDMPEMKELHVPLEEYEAVYEKLIQQTLTIAKGMILMTPYYMEPNLHDPVRMRMDAYGAVVKRLAGKYNLIFVDLQAAWDELFTHMHSSNIAWDRVHPNQIGHMFIARTFLQAAGYSWQGE